MHVTVVTAGCFVTGGQHRRIVFTVVFPFNATLNPYLDHFTISRPTSPFQPSLTPPPGMIPDFQDPYSVQPFLTLTAVFSIIVTTTFVALRMFAKVRILKSVKWEDCKSHGALAIIRSVVADDFQSYVRSRMGKSLPHRYLKIRHC